MTRAMITITGTVASGDQRGRVLGFPTANIPMEDRDDLNGVWAGLVEFEEGSTHPAAISIGRRRTFYGEDSELLLEAHLINFSGDLYGRTLRVHLTKHLRGQVEFASVQELTDQMQRDVSRALRSTRWSTTLSAYADRTPMETATGEMRAPEGTRRSRRLPRWAVQRVEAVLRTSGDTSAVVGIPVPDIARRAGISKSLARRCLDQLNTHKMFSGKD
jgi:hypothetical protein